MGEASVAPATMGAARLRASWSETGARVMVTPCDRAGPAPAHTACLPDGSPWADLARVAVLPGVSVVVLVLQLRDVGADGVLDEVEVEAAGLFTQARVERGPRHPPNLSAARPVVQARRMLRVTHPSSAVRARVTR